MNMKKLTAIAAAMIIAAGICTGVPMGTGNSSPLAVTASANTVSDDYPKAFADENHIPASFSAIGGNGTVDVKWDAVNGAKSYEVSLTQKDGNKNIQVDSKTVTATSCKFEKLSAGTYYILIQPDNAEAGVMLDNITVTASTKAANTESYTCDVKLYDDKTADVTWKELDGAYFYLIYTGIADEWDNVISEDYVYVSTTAKKDFKLDDITVKAISEARYTIDISAMPKNGYAFIYVAPGDKNSKSMANVDGVYTKNLKVNKRSASSSSSKTAAPANFKASKTKNSVTLTWDKADGADMYRVYKYNDKTGKYEKYKDVKSAKCTVSGLKAGTKYKFKVVSYSKNKDGKYVKGESSKAVSVTTKK